MTVSNTKLFNIRSAADYYTPIKDVNENQYYLFAARNLPWANTVEAINESVKETEYTIFEEMIFGKIVTPEDIRQMIDKNTWTTGTVYDKYDDEDGNLYSKAFFVVSAEGGNYHVFKCLNNMNGAASTSQPLFSETTANDEYYETSDGYVWKYMYSIDTAEYAKFATADYIPVVVNSSVTDAASNGAIATIVLTSGGNNYVSYANGVFTNISVAGNTQTHAIDTGSANNDFFTGSAIYISSGAGAGQVRKITDYLVSGTQYLVVVESLFDPQPDLSSNYQIAPNVNIYGDGQGAEAICLVNTSTKSISSISILSQGNSYTYANVVIIGNTGSLEANSAIARAIMSPRAGHGANVYSELNANKVGISVTFANNESNTVPITNDYSRIGVLRNPKFANVEITCINGTLFTTGETIVQYIGVNTALNTFTSTLTDYTYNTGNYKTLTLGAAITLSNGDAVFANTPGLANGIVVSIVGASNTTLVVRQDIGTFTAAANVFKTGTPATNAAISTITAGYANTVYGLDSGNVSFTWANNNNIDVVINDSKIYNKSVLPSNTTIDCFTVNTTAIQLYNKTLANTDTVTVHKYILNAVLANSQYTAQGTVVSANSTVLKLNNATGQFVVNAHIIGLTSNNVTNVTSVSAPTTTFLQTLKLTGIYNGGSNTFALDDYCQQTLATSNVAYGYIQAIDSPGGNTTYDFYLTGVKGAFTTGLNLESANGAKSVAISAVRQPDLHRYSGDVVYAENITAISRSNTQSEQIKLVINYY